MKVRSLRLRLMGLAVIWVVASLIAAAAVLQYLFTINVERTARENMEATLVRLAALIDPDEAIPTISVPLPDPRYATPLGGRYWQIEALDNGEISRSRSLWDYVIEAPVTDDTVHHQDGPDDRHLILLTRRLEIDGQSGRRPFLVTVGEDHEPIHAATQTFARDITGLLVLLGIIIIGAAWLQIRLGLAPIARVRDAIEQVRRGEQARLDGSFPSELDPLVEEVNQLLAVREVMTERARSRASDLAHGLKTPLAALHGIAGRLRDKGNNSEADLLQDLSFEMSERVDYQLRLATLQLRTGAHIANTSLNSAVLRTVAVLKKTGRGEGLHWIAELADDCKVDIHRQDLMELVGVTLENAAKWAASRVIVRSSADNGMAVLEICDDGPGIPREQLAQLGERGKRLDESLPGTGLGLAIAGEILAINGGAIEFSQAQIGGLVVKLRLPLAPDDVD